MWPPGYAKNWIQSLINQLLEHGGKRRTHSLCAGQIFCAAAGDFR
jgi:hypothetical protein